MLVTNKLLVWYSAELYFAPGSFHLSRGTDVETQRSLRAFGCLIIFDKYRWRPGPEINYDTTLFVNNIIWFFEAMTARWWFVWMPRIEVCVRVLKMHFHWEVSSISCNELELF